MAVKNCDGVPALARLLRRRGEGQEGREMAECVTGESPIVLVNKLKMLVLLFSNVYRKIDR